MVEFFISLVIFILAHVLPEPTGLRTRLITRYGKKTYVAYFSLLSAILLVWLIWNALHAPYINLWQTNQVTLMVPVILMLPACILFTTSILKPNPLSLAFVQQSIFHTADITVILKHPILWSLFFWALSHTIANGDLVAVIMFGGFAIFSLIGMKTFEHRAKRTLSKSEFETAMARTDGPLAFRLNSTMNWTMAAEVIAGIVLYVIVLHLHEPIIGIDPLVQLLP